MILFDIGSAAWKLEEWKRDIWDSLHIGIPWHDRESNDAVIFGFLTVWFISEVDSRHCCSCSFRMQCYNCCEHHSVALIFIRAHSFFFAK